MLNFEYNENNELPYFARNVIFAEKTDSNVMRIDLQFKKTLFGHMVLSLLFFWYYVHNSFLRPAVEPGTEYFLALLIIVAAEVNFWILYPAFQNSNRTLLYFLLSAVEVIVLSIVEYLLTIDVIHSKMPMELSDADRLLLKGLFFMNLLLRNCGLMSVVMILAYNADLRIRMFDKDRKLFRLKRQLLVQTLHNKSPYLLDEGRICYIQQRQNYNCFFTNDGERFERRSSLTDIQNLLGVEDYIQISKNAIISKSYLKSCNEDEIVLSTDENIEDYRLTIGKGYRSEVLPVVKALLDRAKQVLPESESPQPQPYLPELSPKALAIFQYISTCQGCKISDIKENTRLPKSTVTRYLKNLQQEGLIKYEGNKRVGGYHAIEPPTA